jgi:hypothetical protein
MRIDIRRTCGKRTITRAEGEKINRIISKNWNQENLFYIDFDSVLVASVSFMDEAFGKLALMHTKEEMQGKLKFENILDYDRALINDIVYSRFRQKKLGENGASLKRPRKAQRKSKASRLSA